MMSVKWLLALVAAATLGTHSATAEADNRLAVAIGEPGSDSFTFGTELWAMSQIALMPAHGITLKSREAAVDEDRLSLLQKREVEAALVYGGVPNAYDNDVRAIMALWPRGISSEDADPVQFLVHKDVAAEVVYLITKAMFEHANYFKSAHASLGIGLPSEAMTGLEIPLHAGAHRYYQEHGFEKDQIVAADYGGDGERTAAGEAKPASSTFSNLDDTSLEADEIEQVAAACRHALEIGSLSLVLGDLSRTGCEVYQDRLIGDALASGTHTAMRKAPAVAAFATSVQASSDGDTEENLFASPVGQGGPAIRWVPPVAEAGANNAAGSQPPPQRVIRQPTM